MVAAGVPEKMIKEVTGHKSSKALEIYERPTVPQRQALANVLNGSCPCDVGMEVTNLKMQCGEKRVTKNSTTQQNGGAPFMGPLFQGLNNCTVNISPRTSMFTPTGPTTHFYFHFKKKNFNVMP